MTEIRNSPSGELIDVTGGGPPSGPAGGDLGGTYPDPEVVAITETGGPTSLVFGTIADGLYLKRVGATIVGAAAVSLTPPTNPAQNNFVAYGNAGDLSYSTMLNVVGGDTAVQIGGAGATTGLLRMPQTFSMNAGATNRTVISTNATTLTYGSSALQALYRGTNIDIIASASLNLASADGDWDASDSSLSLSGGIAQLIGDTNTTSTTPIVSVYATAGVPFVDLKLGSSTAFQATKSGVDTAIGVFGVAPATRQAPTTLDGAITALNSYGWFNAGSIAYGSGVSVGTANAAGASTSISRADHTHQVTGVVVSGPTALTFGAVADGQVVTRSGTTLIGTSVPALTANAPANVTKSAAVVGVGTAAARDDHKHDITTAAAGSVGGAANAEGVATSLARSDHNHRVTGFYDSATALTFSVIADGELLQRSGTNVQGVALGGQISGDPGNVAVNGVTVSGPVSLSTSGSTVNDGQYLRRSGTSLVGTPSWYETFNPILDAMQQSGAIDATVVGSNFNYGVQQFANTSDFIVLQKPVTRPYFGGSTVTVRLYWNTTATTGTITWRGNIAAITPGDAQSVTTKAFGTSVDSSADAPNGTASGLVVSTLTFDVSGELNSMAPGDMLWLKIMRQTSTGSPGTARLMGVEMYAD